VEQPASVHRCGIDTNRSHRVHFHVRDREVFARAGKLASDAPVSNEFAHQYYSIQSDGQRFLVSNAVEGLESPPITVVLNWTAGLDR
jgi:hypothetical protein